MTYVHFDSWAGRTKARVTVLKPGPKRTKVRFEERAFWRPVGHIQYVPNHSLQYDPLDRLGPKSMDNGIGKSSRRLHAGSASVSCSGATKVRAGSAIRPHIQITRGNSE